MRQTSVIVLAFVVAVALPQVGTAQTPLEKQTLRASVARTVDAVTLEPAWSESASSELASSDAALPKPITAADATPAPAQGATSPPPRAFEYSDGYHTRAKIHRIASFATIPLFVTQGILGASIYNDPTDGKRTAHQAVAVGIGGLFALNTTTGVWNLLEARKDPNFQKRRLVHGLLMLGSDAGLVATFATAPPEEGGGSRATHRALAITSIGAATTGYLIMLFGAH
jgi:hypothetical protein